MPRPVFILCSQSCAVDQFTGFLSLYHVIEGYTFAETTPEQAKDQARQGYPLNHEPFPRFLINAVWMREDEDDPGDKYEFEVWISLPGKDRKVVQTGQCQIQKRFFRVTCGVYMSSPLTQAGLGIVEARLRKVGSEQWVTQDFPIPIEVIFSGSSEMASMASEPAENH